MNKATKKIDLEYIINTLNQINNSCYNLNVYGWVIHEARKNRINTIKHKYNSKTQLEHFEQMYIGLAYERGLYKK